MSVFLSRASAVGVVVITSGTVELKTKLANGCGVAYTGIVMQSVLNLEDGKPVQFRARTSLSITGTYLVFLTDTIDLSADPTSTLSGIKSGICASSGITLTAMTIGESGQGSFGPEAIMERRHRPGGSHADYHLSERYFFGNRAFAKLMDEEKDTSAANLKPLFTDVERAEFVAHCVAFPEDALLQSLERIANPSYSISLHRK